MKKFFIAIILSAFAIFGNNFCSASMPRSEMYLGGLTFGSSSDYMVELYGLPDTNERGVEYLSTCKYGSGVEIGYLADQHKIFSIIVRENNGWTTPAGLAVGMNREKIFDLYGRADFEKVGTEKTAYAYFYYSYNNRLENYERESGFIIFVDNATGKILEMRLETNNSMAAFEDFFEPSVNYFLGIENE
ncbi:MAG: hypothetical protein IJT73_03775 [Selenomonadaceae bacterium]|nr:hypothetical protein [Selenomonadaceae bacterium]